MVLRLARLTGNGLDLDEALAVLTPVQRELLVAMLSGDDESPDADVAQRHGLDLPALRRLRSIAVARLRDLLSLNRA
jgi:hypothetical protein